MIPRSLRTVVLLPRLLWSAALRLCGAGVAVQGMQDFRTSRHFCLTPYPFPWKVRTGPPGQKRYQGSGFKYPYSSAHTTKTCSNSNAVDCIEAECHTLTSRRKGLFRHFSYPFRPLNQVGFLAFARVRRIRHSFQTLCGAFRHTLSTLRRIRE
jgi:hypothetical protein